MIVHNAVKDTYFDVGVFFLMFVAKVQCRCTFKPKSTRFGELTYLELGDEFILHG